MTREEAEVVMGQPLSDWQWELLQRIWDGGFRHRTHPTDEVKDHGIQG